MVGIHSEVREQKRFAARLFASAARFDCHKNGVDLRQGLGVVELQNPTLLGSIVFVEDAQIQSLLEVGKPELAMKVMLVGDDPIGNIPVKLLEFIALKRRYSSAAGQAFFVGKGFTHEDLRGLNV